MSVLFKALQKAERENEQRQTPAGGFDAGRLAGSGTIKRAGGRGINWRVAGLAASGVLAVAVVGAFFLAGSDTALVGTAPKPATATPAVPGTTESIPVLQPSPGAPATVAAAPAQPASATPPAAVASAPPPAAEPQQVAAAPAASPVPAAPEAQAPSSAKSSTTPASRLVWKVTPKA